MSSTTPNKWYCRKGRNPSRIKPCSKCGERLNYHANALCLLCLNARRRELYAEQKAKKKVRKLTNKQALVVLACKGSVSRPGPKKPDRAGWSTRDLAQHFGISRAVIYAIQNGYAYKDVWSKFHAGEGAD